MLSLILEMMPKKDIDTYEKYERLKVELKNRVAGAKTKYFEENWKKTLPFVDELLSMEKPKYTEFIKVSTTFGKPNSSVYVINTTEIIHNPEFVKTVLAFGAIWRSDLGLSARRIDITPAITQAFERASEYKGYEDIYNRYYADDKNVSYLYFTSIIWEDELEKYGASNMGTKICKMKAIVY